MSPHNPPMHTAAPRGRRFSRFRVKAVAALTSGLLLAAGSFGVTAGVAAQAATTHKVTYDQYSFMVDGKRVNLWSGEFHYFRLPSPDLWRDVLTKIKAAGFNAVSLYFDWAYHSPRPGVYDFTGIRDVDRLLKITDELGIYVIARPGPYINAEVDSGGFPGWMTTQAAHARSNEPEYLKAGDEWLSKIDPIIAKHQLTKGTGTVITYQVENEFYKTGAGDRAYMQHLEDKARVDGITVPFVGNHNNNYNTGAGAVDVDMPDGYPQGFNCSNPTKWSGVSDFSWGRSPGKPLGIGEFQGGSFDPWGGPGYDACRTLTGPDFEKVFYKNNIAQGITQQSFYMTYGGTSWGWQPDPSQVYSSYDYGAAITESRQLTGKYDEDKRIGYFTQAVAPLAKTDPLVGTPVTSSKIVDLARINPDDGTQFHMLRHTSNDISTGTDTTQLSLDLAAKATTSFTYDDPDSPIAYTGTWSHVGADQSYTGGDYNKTESFSNTAGDSVSIKFTGTAIRWISSKELNHGIADVYLDGTDDAHKVATVDGYSSSKVNQQVFYAANGLANIEHTLTIKVTGKQNASATGTYVVVDAIDLPKPGADKLVYPTVPQKAGTAITLAGRDAKIIVANYKMGAQQLQYSTSEIMTHAQIGDRDVALLYGRSGEDGETVLHYAAQPTVKVLDGSVDSTWDATRDDLRLNYKHTGLARVLITGGTRPLLLLLATDQVAATFWRQQTAAGPILVRGPYLLRTAQQSGSTLDLTGDTAAASDLEVFSTASSINWNGAPVNTKSTDSGTQQASLAGPRKITLPELTGWKHAVESPEAQTGFVDSKWVVANKTTTNNPTKPTTLPVLYADDYGYHYGDVWYRAHFTGPVTGVKLSAMTGRAGAWSVWLNGTFLGSSSTVGSNSGSQEDFTFPAGVLKKGADNVLSVLVENMGHNEDWTEGDTHKEPRGLTGATFDGGTPSSIKWLIQGAQGGESGADPVRGPMNNGGLFGERNGWSKPEFNDSAWTSVSLAQRDTTPGVSWYRTNVKLDLPKDQDTSVGLNITDDKTHHYRVLIFVNGWQMGRYVNDTGPQHSFPIPNGVLNPNGDNSIALAVWNTDATSGGLGTVRLESYGSQLTAKTQVTTPTPTPTAGSGGQPGGASGSAKPSSSVSASSSAGAGTGGLAKTGSAIAMVAGIGIVFVGFGVLLYVLARRRRAGFAGGRDEAI